MLATVNCVTARTIRNISSSLRFLRVLTIFSALLLSAEMLIAGGGNLDKGFVTPPDEAKPRVYWFWIFNRVDKEGITRDLVEFKAKGISGVTLICNGG